MAVALMVLVCFLVLISSFFSICRNYIVSEYRVDMENSAREVARVASAMGQAESLSGWSLRMSLSSIANSTGNHIFIADNSGRIVSCSDRSPVCEHLRVTVTPEITDMIDQNGELDQITTLGGLYGHNRFVIGLPISGGSGNLGYVFVSNNIDNILGAWSTFMAIAMLISGGVFFAALLVTLVYSKRMARPLDEIAAASAGIEKLGGRVADCSEYRVPGDENPRYMVIIEKVRPTPAAYPRQYGTISKNPL